MDCQEREIQIIEDALGHTYDDNWTYELMKQSRACLSCEHIQVIEYKNKKVLFLMNQSNNTRRYRGQAVPAGGILISQL